MKKILFAIISLLFVVTACDKMEGPHYVADDTIVVDVDFPALDASSVYRKILVEEYTGHLCTSCPQAHDKLKNILAERGDSLVAMCIHAGSLARTNLEFTTDYTTLAGNQLHADFGISTVPAAVINRTKYQNQWNVGADLWANAINAMDRSRVPAALQVINEYNDSYQRLRTYVKTTMLENYDESLSLSIFMIEEGLISLQLLNGSVKDTAYNHKHVLRTGINGTYGKPLLLEGDLLKDSTYAVGYEVRFAGKIWKPENCYIIAVLHNPATKEVVQVEKCAVR